MGAPWTKATLTFVFQCDFIIRLANLSSVPNLKWLIASPITEIVKETLKY